MTPSREAHERQEFAGIASVAVALLLFTVAALAALQGLAAVVDDNHYVVDHDYVYRFDATAWGWVHIVLGVLLALVAIGLVAGASWARIAAMALAVLSILSNFLWMPYAPAWSLLIIALDVVVIWALATWKPADFTPAA